MNAVVYYSNTGQSRAVAAWLAERLGFPLLELASSAETSFESLVLVFPVHCQGIPDAVRRFLKKVRADALTAVATYGRMCPGNALYALGRRYGCRLVAAAYVPTKHAYLEESESFSDFERLEPLVEKTRRPDAAPISLPRLYRNVFAGIFPAWRSRLAGRIVRGPACTACGVCTAVCPNGAMADGIPDRKCIRCLRCVRSCPDRALTFRPGLLLRLYLRKKPVDRILIYT